ncbi:MAG: hypothetical protein A3K76_02225 [Euryarchaeota archaeon RBG_13_57_23]|nr:MAG: hypothetical protein A3K76_02225 [Euryarchaeota archaeon RBG_13_57_23]
MLVASSVFALAKPAATSVQAVVSDEPISDAEWTVMVYLDADNTLEVNGFQDLAEMEKVGSTAGVNVIVLFDGYTSFVGSHWFYIAPGSDHILDDGTIKCDCAEIAPDHKCPGELNMGDGATLEYFINTAVDYCPADNYMLDLWDHGGGWWAICVDDSSFLPSGKADRMEMDEVRSAITATGVHLGIIAYDACFMGMVEVAYENRGLADYMVASITTMPGTGYNYTALLNGITGLAVKDAKDISCLTVDAYIDAYTPDSGSGIGGFPYVSSSVFDLNKVVELVGVGNSECGLDALGKALLGYADDYTLRGAIQSSESQTPQLQFMGENFAFIDIGYFVTLLGEKIPDISALAEGTFGLLDEAVVYCKSVTADSGACIKTYGMSIYYTICWEHLYESYLTSGLDFVSDTSWDEFLFAFSQVYEE